MHKLNIGMFDEKAKSRCEKIVTTIKIEITYIETQKESNEHK